MIVRIGSHVLILIRISILFILFISVKTHPWHGLGG